MSVRDARPGPPVSTEGIPLPLTRRPQAHRDREAPAWLNPTISPFFTSPQVVTAHRAGRQNAVWGYENSAPK